MKFTSIYLLNYIGIYNGMGLYELQIDFTKCRNRVTVIRGDNGSGKSTLMKSLSLFPDPNDAFIPGMPAKKEIVLIDNQTFYKIVFIHDIKSNGDRETTKAYITKTFGTEIVELNPNGNVTSFKDILYSELGLDSNFVALSQLSNDDRGLADKKPAERKRFVNSIISSLEVYNNIYKSLSKKSNSFKSMISAITAKLDNLGNEDVLRKNLEVLETNINTIQDRKDAAISLLAQEQSKISILDPSGTIQEENKSLLKEVSRLSNLIQEVGSIISSLMEANSIKQGSLINQKFSITEKKNSAIVHNQITRNELQSLMKQKELEAEDLAKKLHKLTELSNNLNLESIEEQINFYTSEMESIKRMILEVGITDMESLTKEEYILSLQVLKSLSDSISSFKGSASYETIEKIINQYLETGTPIPAVNVQGYMDNKSYEENTITRLTIEYNDISSKMSLLDTLSIRPSDCKNDACPFISEAKKFADTNPQEQLDMISFEIEERTKDLAVINKLIEEGVALNSTINQFNVILRDVTHNAIILSKMPNGDMFKDIRLFFERLLNGYSFEYMSHIYNYIDLANQFDIYKQYKSVLEDLLVKRRDYESKISIIDDINHEIAEINFTLTEIAEKIDNTNNEILEREKLIVIYQNLEGIYDTIIAKKEERDNLLEELKPIQSRYNENEKAMEVIQASLNAIGIHNKTISECNNSLLPLMKERDKLTHSIQMMEDYKAEKAELEENYSFIETLKYYSSPTTGIQLVFMELYMGKIIALANDLLSFLFNGQYRIQPFVINESEFRIPCLGGGYINDDISSMSSSQIGMISMILSFSLLHNSSTKYNIIKLDEIDGPLDYTNRTYFTDVLNKIMDIMGTEQCIMISHNSELQMDNFDIILLKHDIDNSDYNRGNIIWSY